MQQTACPYRQFPTISITGYPDSAAAGAESIRERVAALCQGRKKTVVTVECYPGVDQSEVLALFSPLGLAGVIHSDSLACLRTKSTRPLPGT